MTYDANVETVPDGSSVKVTWNALEGVDGVQIYRSESPDSGFASVGTSIGTSFTDSTVSMGKTYYYKLKAYKMLDGQKTFFNPSNIVSATILPSAPTNFKAEDALSSTRLSWTAVPNIEGYYVFRSESPDKDFVAVSRQKGTSFTNKSGLTVGNTYYYKVKSFVTVNGKRVFSNSSNIDSAVPSSIVAVALASKTIYITWNSMDGVDGYYLFRSESPNSGFVKISALKGTSFTNTLGLTSGKTYHYKVKPYNTVNGKNELGTAESLPMPGAIKNPSRFVVEPGRVFNFVEQ